jgi:hypothetical protein
VKTTDSRYWHTDGLMEEATESTFVNIGTENNDEEFGDRVSACPQDC